jgi:hypothetical protein
MDNLRLAVWLAFRVVMFSTVLMGPSAALAEGVGAESGLAWLRATQRADGLWGFDDRLVVRDSVEVLQAFESLSPADAILLSARETLVAQAPSTVDLEARLAAAMRTALPEPLLAVWLSEVAAMRSQRGGWGITAGYETCDALDTALALRSLVGTSYLSTSNLVADIGCLTGLQNADGGFGQANGEISDLKTSAEVLLALAAVTRVGTVEAIFEPLVQFLAGQQLADGGFPAFAGDAASDVRTTALVASALVSSGANASSLYPPARSYLLAAQLANGSWEDSAYATALAVLALGSPRPDLYISKAEFTPNTQSRGPDASLSITIANLGLAQASPTVTKVFLGDPSAGGALQATIQVPEIPPGGVRTVSAMIPTMLTIETSLAYFVVADAENALAEACETNNRAVAMLEITGTPPPTVGSHGPEISSAYSIRATEGTTYTYQMVASDADGDPLLYGSLSMPSGMTIDYGTGLITWAVNVPAGTRVTVEAHVCDPNYACDAQAWSIDVVAPGTTWPPTIDTVPSSAGVVGQPYLYALDGTDPDGGPITYVLSSGPEGMVINPSTNVLSWTPTATNVGDNIIRVVAIDAQNESSEQQWIIAVEPASVLKPDLTIVAIDLTQSMTDPQTLHRDGAIVVTVANQGTGAAGAFSLVVYEDRDGSGTYDPASDRLLGTASESSLVANQRTDVVVPISGETLFRDNRVAVYVDPENLVEELREDNNGDLSGSGTRFIPVPGPFRATLKWSVERPNYGGGYQSPIAVGQLTDDNGDGRRDGLDTPEIVAAGEYESLVTAYDGRNGSLVWVANRGPASTIPAIADVDGDGVPEVYLAGSEYHALFNANGAPRWRTTSPGAYGYSSWLEGAIADLEGDGKAEIVAPTAIIEADGVVRCYFPIQPLDTIVADVDLDGKQEIIALPYVLRSDCSLQWSHTEWGITSAGLAVAQLDSDPQPEIIWTRSDGLWIVEHDGTVKWKALTPSGYGPGNTTYVSRPAVGDVDGDGQPEIVFNDRFRVGAYKSDGTMRWFAGQFTAEPRGGSPALADLNGDGQLEVVQNDDSLLRIYRGRTGDLLFSYSNSYIGIPAIADVDGDGHLELVVPHMQPGTYGGAMRVFGNPNWAPGPRLWNQPSYHITNIQEDMRVPVHELPSWQAHNTYRAQASLSHTVCAECGDTAATADLTASFIRVDASGCGAQAQYTVRVGNGGGLGVPAGVKVRFAEGTAEGSVVVGDVLTTKTLASGEYEDVKITAAGRSEPIQIVATVDPGQAVADGKQDNNVHSFSAIPCSPYDDTPPRFITSPSLHAEVGRDWVYFPAAFDADGDVVAFELTTWPAGMRWPTASGPVVWKPTSDQLGYQEVAIQATDGRGGRDVQTFLVEVRAPALSDPPPLPPAGNLVLDVVTDKPSYGPGESVAVTTSIANQSNAGRAGVLRVELRDTTGLVLASVVDPRNVIFTGPTTQTIPATVSTGVLLAGSYAIVAIYDEGAAESVAQAPFDVTGSPSLSVSAATEHSQYGANESVRIVGQMQNGSPNTVLEGLLPKLSVLDGAGTVLAQQEFPSLSLGPSSLQREEMLFDTALVPPGDYRARLEVRQSDAVLASAESHFTIAASGTRGTALNGAVVANPGTVELGSSFALTGSMTNIGNGALAGLDARLQVVDPASQQIVREQQNTADLALGASTGSEAIFSTVGLPPKSYIGRFLVTVAGRMLLSVATEVMVDAGPPPSVGLQVPPCGTADVTPIITVQASVPPATQVAFLDAQAYAGQPVTTEGVHLLEVQVTDGIGRIAAAAVTFVIDRTAPSVSIEGAAEDGAYNGPVTLAIAASDPNLVATTATLNGAVYESGSAITAEDNYQVDVEAADCAGNRGTQRLKFQIDLTPPVVAIDVPTCAHGPVTPVIAEIEANPAGDVRLLDGTAYDGSPVTAEGLHVLVVTATDRAGNHGVAQASFVVDNTPPVVTVSGVVAGGAYPAAVTPQVSATDPNLVASSVTLDGMPFVSGTTVDKEGEHLLVATARDCAGNPATVSSPFTIDITAPQIVIEVPACSAGLVTPIIRVTEPHVAKDERLLDGQPYDNGGVTAEGQHRLKVTVTDTAGNAASQSVDFTVDNTAPTITLAGVESGRTYKRPVTPEVVFQDAVEITLTLNGQPFTSGTEIPDDGDYALAATAKDCAGNQANLHATFQIDQVAPAVTIEVASCQEGPVTPVVTVTETHLATDQRTLDGQPWDGSVITAEGAHILRVVATDNAGNSTEAEVNFVVDNTPPAIAVAGVEDGAWYHTPVTPVVSITETNLSSVATTLDDQVYLNETPVGVEGTHVLIVTATDCAGHTAARSTGFGLDFTVPNLGLAGIPTCTALDVLPQITADEPVTLVETLDGQPYQEGVPIVTEGNHHLSVVATDRAGNTSSLTSDFVVDRSPPLLSFVNIIDGAAYGVPVSPLVNVTDANLVLQTNMLDGLPFTNGTVVSADGWHVLLATAADCAGQVTSLGASFLIDKVSPVVTITVPACSADAVTPLIALVEANPASQTETLDGASYSGGAVSAEGGHDLSVLATDMAGNQGSTSAHFIIDKTAPILSIGGVQNGVIYQLPVTPTVSASDTNLTTATATLNDLPFVSGTSVASDGTYTLMATASDCAGHQASQTVQFQIQSIAGTLSHEIDYGSRTLLANEYAGGGPQLLRTVLTGAAIPWEEATTRAQWLGKLRSGRFNQVMLYRPAAYDGGSSLPELNEAVWIGDGLVLIKDSTDPQTTLREALGLDFSATALHPTSLTLLSPLQPATLAMTGAAVKLQLTTGVVAGRPRGDNVSVVAALSGRGLGEALTVAWDAETSGSQPFYQSALSATAPASGVPLLAGGSTRLRTTVHNTSIHETQYTLVQTLASALCTMDPLQYTVVVPGGGSKDQIMTVHLPVAAGNFTVTSRLSADGRQLDEKTYTFAITLTTSVLQSQAVSGLQGLSLTGLSAQKRDQAVSLLNQAAQAASPLDAVGLVWRAIDAARGITGIDLTANRVALARLLRSYEMATGGSGVSANLDGLPCFAYAIDAAATCSKRPPSPIDSSGCITINASTYVDAYSHSLGPYGGGNKDDGDVAMRCNDRSHDTNNTCVDNCGSACISGSVHYLIDLHYAAIAEPPSVPNSTQVNVNSGQSVTLDPAGGVAFYDTIAVNSGGTLTLKTGSFVVRNLLLNSGGTFKINGTVRLWVRNPPSPSTSVTISSNNPRDFWLIYNGTGTINNNSTSKFYGVLYAPAAKVNLNYEVFGAVVAGGITLNSGAKVHYDTDLTCPSGGGSNPDAGVPPGGCTSEPGASF